MSQVRLMDFGKIISEFNFIDFHKSFFCLNQLPFLFLQVVRGISSNIAMGDVKAQNKRNIVVKHRSYIQSFTRKTLLKCLYFSKKCGVMELNLRLNSFYNFWQRQNLFFINCSKLQNFILKNQLYNF